MNVKSLGGVVAALLFLVAGLIDSPNATAQDRYKLASQPQVYLVHQTAKPFLIEGTGYRVFAGGIASIVQANESAKLQQSLDLRDPVNYLKDRLADALRNEVGLTNLQIQADASDLPILPDGLSDEARAAKAPTFKDKHPTGVVIEVLTRHWGIDNYKMKYYASIWVTDLGNSKRLMSASCPWVIFEQVQTTAGQGGFNAQGVYVQANPAADGAVKEEALYANNGALLKANLRKAAEQCADKIATRFKK